MVNPVAAFEHFVFVSDRKREQRFEFTDSQLFPRRAVGNRQAEYFPQRTFIREIHGLQFFQQSGAFFLGQIVETHQQRAQQIADAVVLPFQVFDRINLAHAGHKNAAAVRALFAEIGDVNVFAFGVNRVHEPVVVFLRGRAEIPIGKLEVRRIAHEIPADYTA